MNLKFMHRVFLIVLLAMAFPAASFAGFEVGIGINVGFAPPPLPVYVQPPCPAPGYIWTPGYWGYSDDDEDYYWVPGKWVMAPSQGLLWTPGYWAEVGGEYDWREGYWGPQVGFYGGINYGFGYFGAGFVGGYWRGGDFFYNRSVTNVSNVHVTNVYDRTVNNNFYGSRASFNGVNGVPAAPTHGDLLAARLPHYGPSASQRTQAESARATPTSLASLNHGHPPVAAHRSGPSQWRGVVAANGAQGRIALAHDNRGQSLPATGHSFASLPHGLPVPRGTNSYQTPHGYQVQPTYQSPRTFPMGGTYQTTRKYQTSQTPRSYQAPHTYRASQAPHIDQASRNGPANPIHRPDTANISRR